MSGAPATYRAVWNGAVLAESSETIQIEGNQYFPPSAVNRDHFRDSDTHTVCSWKGTASYYTIEAGGQTNADAAWYYPEPKEPAREIKDYVAFWRGVTVEQVDAR